VRFTLVSLTLVIAVEADTVPTPVAVIVPVYVPAIILAKSGLVLFFTQPVSPKLNYPMITKRLSKVLI
jgi:hypothetical protein